MHQSAWSIGVGSKGRSTAFSSRLTSCGVRALDTSGSPSFSAVNSDWLLYSLGELAKLFKRVGLNSEIDVLRKRVESGVGKELIELTALQGVGRVRARSLHTAGYKSIEDIQEAPADNLALVEKIGTALARKLKEQVSRF